MKRLRYVLCISWTKKRTNEWVLNIEETERETETKRQLLESIRKSKLTYFGHMMRKKEESLQKEIIQWNMLDARTRGRPKMRWMDNIRTWTGLAMEELLRLVKNRQGWRNIVQNTSNRRIENE